MNEDLEALHMMLNDYVRVLARAQEQATTIDAIRAIGHEIDEVGNRATMVGQLLFKAQTARLTAAVEVVKAGTVDLDKAIAQIQQLNDFLKAISKFLGLVDKAIDLAKLIF